MIRLFLSFCIVFVHVSLGEQKIFNLYVIGNSLVWSSVLKAYRYSFEQKGYDLQFDHHIACGKSIEFIEQNDNQDYLCVEPNYWTHWREALESNSFDAIILQPHLNANLENEYQALSRIIELVSDSGLNARTAFYLFGSWPKVNSGSSVSEVWEQSLGTSYSSQMFNTREELDYLYLKLKKNFPDVAIYSIPVGSVLNAFEKRFLSTPLSLSSDYLAEGQSNTIGSMEDFYKDNIHLHYSTGKFLAHLTSVSAILNTDPYELELQPNWLMNVDPQLIDNGMKIVSQILQYRFGMEKVLNESQNFNLYSKKQFQDLRSGASLIELEAGTARFSLDIERSSDLSTWSLDQRTTVEIPVEAGADTQFFRFKMSD